MSPPPLVGIFVGGLSTRMGGYPKGLLRAPTGEPIVERWRALATAVGLPSVLVGDALAYAHLGMETISDEQSGAGPLGGLVGLLRSRSDARMIAVACDMPHMTEPLLRRLAFAETDAAALAPQRDGRFEPLFARYERERVLPLAEEQLGSGDRSLQRLLRAVEAEPFALSHEEWALLDDWDVPPDISR
jgi:molybdopterin-guanine dinucleotide biosynthesis protein A